MILRDRSSTIVPNAPITVVMLATARMPAMIQLSVSALAPDSFGRSDDMTSPKNNTYSPKMMRIASSEKNTEACPGKILEVAHNQRFHGRISLP